MATQIYPVKTTWKGDSATPGKSSQSFTASISNVRVIIRVRPFLPHENYSRNGNPVSCVSVIHPESEFSEEVTVHLKDQETSRSECYNLDSFFGYEDNIVTQIFQREVSPLIPGIFHGYNATVFAYGATGSGKTFTMQGSDELPGLMPLAMSTILSVGQSKRSTAEISYYEVYMDKCYDLLEPKAKEIPVLDGKDGQTHLKGLARVPVNSLSEFREAFSCAVQRRKIAHTGRNDVSSRSHGVLVIGVSTPSDDTGKFFTGKLNLIDLAGNEDNKRTCNEGIRLLESAKINQSLFALSNVVYALNNNKPYIPYRESKLTRILQDSLGGTSRALMVACLNPGEYQESVHTVSLAARSRHISNFVSPAEKQLTPKVKVDMEAKLRAWLESKGKTKSAQRLGYKTPGSGSATKISNSYQQSARTRDVHTHVASNLQERTSKACCKSNNGDVIGFLGKNPDRTNEGNRKQADGEMSESVRGIPDVPVNTKTKTDAEYVYFSPVIGKAKVIQSQFRQVFSPINSNINIDNSSSRDELYLGPDLKTPETTDKYQSYNTPLDKLNERSSNLKSSFMQEYIDFLNTASREELMELKGIGEKMAVYILELRETSPLKSLTDLQKIGLSSKQVHNIFGRAARGLF